jgi:predicted dehydrogenase
VGELGIALIGYGHWGPNLARSLDAVHGTALRAVCVRTERGASAVAAARLGIEATTDLGRLLERPDVDVVVVATPAPSHAELARKALLAGKHVMVEKPLATSLAAARDVITLAAERGRTLMVGHVYVYHPVVRRLAELLSAGDLGDLVCVASERGNPTGTPADGSVLWNLAPHDLSIVVHLLGPDARRVSARAPGLAREGSEELIFLTIELASGALVEIQVSWIAPTKTRRMTFTGSAAIAVFDELAREPLGVFARRDGEPPERLDVPPPAAVEPLHAQWEEFVSAVREGREPVTGARHALAVQRLAEAAKRSLARGGADVVPAADS